MRWFPNPEREAREREAATLKTEIRTRGEQQRAYNGRDCPRCPDGSTDHEHRCYKCGWRYNPPEPPEEQKWVRKKQATYGVAVCPGNRLFACGKQFTKRSPSQTRCCAQHTDAWAKNHPRALKEEL